MLMMTRSIASPCTLACALALSAPSTASVLYPVNYLNPAAACQLSTPTTDTQARPKASGYRNESATKSIFAICGFGTSTNGGSGTANYLEIDFTSIDGVSRNISCTAVSGIAGRYSQGYVTKSIPSLYDGSYAILTWSPEEFGWGGSIPGGFAPSVTCTLPPQTAITLVGAGYVLDAGN